MSKMTLESTLNFAPRFVRSTELERDFHDPHALRGYCLTDFAARCLSRISEGFNEDSSQRAWRLTGDYGSGKSSFALMLAQAAQEEKSIPGDLKRAIREAAPNLLKVNFVPLLVVGSRMSMGQAILQKLETVLGELYTRGTKSSVLVDVEEAVADSEPPSDDAVIQLLSAANEKIIQSGKGDGLILILDEVGKFLEYAAVNPKHQDVMLLQRLADLATRSRKQPLQIICLLHQGFNAYADQLARSSANEWEKVAGRFEEITFRQPLDQIAMLVASAMRTRVEYIPRQAKKQAEATMHQALELGWFGNSVSKLLMIEQALPLYPLDPFIVPIASKIFHRFGQNERSLFSFIFSHEPFGLREFAVRALEGASPYRLHNLYDYIRANMGSRLAAASYRSRWTVIEAVVEAHMDAGNLDIETLKTVGILNLVNSDELRPTDEAISWAIAGNDSTRQNQVIETLARLSKKRRIYYRGGARGYCLWPYTSVDIEKAMEDAKAKIGSVTHLREALKDHLATRPIVARKHYITTGNLRYFNVYYCEPGSLAKGIEASISHLSDGAIFVPLCETEEDRIAVFAEIEELQFPRKRISLVAVPRALDKIRPFILDVQRWSSVYSNTPELNTDSYARQEVEVQKLNAERMLEAKIQEFVGLNRLSAETTLTWFHGKKHLEKIQTGRDLLSKLSDLCDRAFKEHAPKLKNELINRHSLSSSAAAARMRLIERMVTNGYEGFLGMDPRKRPPEMSMYLSVLRASGIHRQTAKGWEICVPEHENDHCNVGPALNFIRERLYARPDERIQVNAIYSALTAQPFGIRAGLLPLFLAVVSIMHSYEIAFYETGSFVADVNGDMFMRLAKAPDRFEVQFCRIEGVRADLFKTICEALALSGHEKTENAKLLSVVQPLCKFVVELPEYTRKTHVISKIAIGVRDALMSAREPVKLVFHDLPIACGVEPFAPGATANPKSIAQFVTALKSALDELRTTMPALRDRISERIQTLFQLSGPFHKWQRNLADRATSLLAEVREPRLHAFTFRLIDENLQESEWIDSIGSYVANKPPERWADRDEDIFDVELTQLVTRFQRVEGIVRQKKGNSSSEGYMRLAVTRLDGKEVDRVLQITPDQKDEVTAMRREIAVIFSKNKKIGLLAAAEEFMEMLGEKS